MKDHIDRYAKEVRDAHTEQTGRKSDDNSLRIEEARHVLLRCTDRAEDTDLLRSLLNGDEGDNTDHDRGYDEGHRNECDENVRDRIDDRRNLKAAVGFISIGTTLSVCQIVQIASAFG